MDPNGWRLLLDILEQYPDILRLREAGVLTEVTPAGLSDDDMLVALFCADGRRFRQVFEHKCSIQRCNLHPLSLNGGAMLLSEACPENETFPWHAGLIPMVIDSCDIQKTKHVALGSHWPCAIAARHELSPEAVITLTLQGRLGIKLLRPDLKVYTFFYVKHPDGRLRSYTVDHDHPTFKDKVLLTAPA